MIYRFKSDGPDKFMALARSGLPAEDCLQNHFELKKAEGFTICDQHHGMKVYLSSGVGCRKGALQLSFSDLISLCSSYSRHTHHLICFINWFSASLLFCTQMLVKYPSYQALFFLDSGNRNCVIFGLSALKSFSFASTFTPDSIYLHSLVFLTTGTKQKVQQCWK